MVIQCTSKTLDPIMIEVHVFYVVDVKILTNLEIKYSVNTITMQGGGLN
jgi:hypothetical protein